MTRFRRFFRPPATHFFLFGPRGTGKSTWLRQAFSDSIWIDLLNPETHRFFAARPERLREQVAANPHVKDVVVDEVQKIPELLDVVHQLIETPGSPRFILTGSSARKLKRAGVDLLAGRAILRRLHPFMAGELGEAFTLDRALDQGLVPLVWDASDPRETLRSYIALYVREEVMIEGLVRNISAFSRFLEAISLSHGSILNLAEVARECEVSRATVAGFLEVLEDLLLSFQVPIFTKRARRQLVSHPKFYWFDAGVFRSLRLTGPLDRTTEIAGAALEGLVAQHLRAWIDLRGRDETLSFWRTRAGNEVDFIVYGSKTFCAIEVKHGTTVHPKDLHGLKAFRSDYPEANLILLYRGNKAIRTGGILCLPIEGFLKSLRPESEIDYNFK